LKDKNISSLKLGLLTVKKANWLSVVLPISLASDAVSGLDPLHAVNKSINIAHNLKYLMIIL
jgi:hypothetical protein